MLSRSDWAGLVGYFGLGAGTKIVCPVDYYGKDITVVVTVWLCLIQKMCSPVCFEHFISFDTQYES